MDPSTEDGADTRPSTPLRQEDRLSEATVGGISPETVACDGYCSCVKSYAIGNAQRVSTDENTPNLQVHAVSHSGSGEESLHESVIRLSV